MDNNAAEYVPSLTLNPDTDKGLPTAAEIAKVAEEKVAPVVLERDQLTEAEQKMVDDFAKQIDITDTNMVLTYGSAAQKNIANFSVSAPRTWARWATCSPIWWWSSRA